MYRLDIKYASLNLVMGGQVCFAPLIDPQQILDIGTGTGIWAIDAAEEYPGATGIFSLSRLNELSLG
jgi:ubiquinone/menaquinone biosynthesis C-methylase UbiE